MTLIIVFTQFCDKKIFNTPSLESKHLFLVEFFNGSDKLNKINPQKENRKFE